MAGYLYKIKLMFLMATYWISGSLFIRLIRGGASLRVIDLA